jgi:hypothetical protein
VRSQWPSPPRSQVLPERASDTSLPLLVLNGGPGRATATSAS